MSAEKRAMQRCVVLILFIDLKLEVMLRPIFLGRSGLNWECLGRAVERILWSSHSYRKGYYMIVGT